MQMQPDHLNMKNQSQQQGQSHVPVMLNEVLAVLDVKPGDVIVDGTFGAGGYSRALLDARCRVIAIDRDPNVKLLAEALARDFPGHFLFLEGCFADMLQLLDDAGIDHVDGVVLDLGVSSMQLDQAERGFSFQADAALDMRMGSQPLTAERVVNEYDEPSLSRILKEYGEEKFARKIARNIIAARADAPIKTTKQLADIVSASVPKTKQKIHPATRSFQAIRIEVNDELGQLKKALESSEQLLIGGGKLVVVSFHSLEDRIVKNFMKARSETAPAFSRHDPRAYTQHQQKTASFDWPKPHKIAPTQEEVAYNPRARSAILRMAIRASQPVTGSV